MVHLKKIFFEDSCVSHAVWHWCLVWDWGLHPLLQNDWPTTPLPYGHAPLLLSSKSVKAVATN